jgi:hypothetical protein
LADTSVEGIIQQFCIARPCLETGWEATLMIRLIASGRADGATLLKDFHPKLKTAEMKALGVSKDQLIKAFNETRSSWIHEDEESWLASHDFYPQAVEATQQLVRSGEDVYIITTKAAGFAKRLLSKIQIFIPDHKVYGLGSGKKWQTILNLLGEDGRAADTRVFFLEDRLAALEEAHIREEVSSKTDLVLAAWGYNGPDTHAAARAKRIAVIEQTDFLQLARSRS